MSPISHSGCRLKARSRVRHSGGGVLPNLEDGAELTDLGAVWARGMREVECSSKKHGGLRDSTTLTKRKSQNQRPKQYTQTQCRDWSGVRFDKDAFVNPKSAEGDHVERVRLLKVSSSSICQSVPLHQQLNHQRHLTMQ